MRNDGIEALRVGVEINRVSSHTECKGLAQVLSSLNEQEGIVRLFDRTRQELIFDGAVGELRDTLQSRLNQQGETRREFMEYFTSEGI